MTSPDEGSTDPAQTDELPAPGLIAVLVELSYELRALARDHLELVALETRLLLRKVLTMAVIAIFGALILSSAWLALIAAAGIALIGAGIAPAVAMLLLAAANLLVAFGCWMLIRRQSNRLGWPATGRALASRAPGALAPGALAPEASPAGDAQAGVDTQGAASAGADDTGADDSRADKIGPDRAT